MGSFHRAISILSLVASIVLSAEFAKADAYGDCKHDQQYTVRAVPIVSIEKTSDKWVVTVDQFADKGCGVGDISSPDQLPASCKVGGKITATGRVFLDYATGLSDAHSISCN